MSSRRPPPQAKLEELQSATCWEKIFSAAVMYGVPATSPGKPFSAADMHASAQSAWSELLCENCERKSERAVRGKCTSVEVWFEGRNAARVLGRPDCASRAALIWLLNWLSPVRAQYSIKPPHTAPASPQL